MTSTDLNIYFSPSAIINILCKYRIKCATKGRKKQVLRNITLIDTFKETLQYNDPFFLKIKTLMPPRSQWLRPKFVDRENKDSNQIAIESIRRRIKVTHYNVTNGGIAPEWYNNLQEFILDIQQRIKHIESLRFENPVIVPEVKKKIYYKDKNILKETICRPIAVFNLEDRIIIGIAAKYLITLFDKIFLPYSYAFKPIKYTGTGIDVIKHHHAIKDILRYRIAQHPKKLWVSECDINKFFDTVNHKITYQYFLKGLNEIQNLGFDFDPRIIEIFKQYLNCYSFKEIVMPLNSDKTYFDTHKIKNGKFDLPLKKMINKFYPRHNKLKKFIGIPQGGAISCFIANLLLHEADKEIHKTKICNDDLFYCRYCDDMILIHPNESICNLALIKYSQVLKKLQLLIHAPIKVLDYTTRDSTNKSAKEFWNFKSKKPYCWDSNKLSSSNVPWIGFVGYQIRFDGNTRVRKTSLEKELLKQKKIYTETLKIIDAKKPINLNKNCNKSKHELINSVNGRLNAMSIGKCSLYNAYSKKAQKFCWLNGFSELTNNPSTVCQLKKLDRSKNRLLHKLNKKLTLLTKKPKSSEEDLEKWKIKFFGHPFSYSKTFKVK